jgi:hypothetical protein
VSGEVCRVTQARNALFAATSAKVCHGGVPNGTVDLVVALVCHPFWLVFRQWSCEVRKTQRKPRGARWLDTAWSARGATAAARRNTALLFSEPRPVPPRRPLVGQCAPRLCAVRLAIASEHGVWLPRRRCRDRDQAMRATQVRCRSGRRGSVCPRAAPRLPVAPARAGRGRPCPAPSTAEPARIPAPGNGIIRPQPQNWFVTG